jgi:inner membrane protein involved in colicin E2 resistance
MLAYIRKHPSLIAYLILIVLNIATIVMIDQIIVEKQNAHAELDKSICQSQVDIRKAVIDFIQEASPPVTIPLDADPATIERLTRQSEQRQRMRETANQLFAMPDCVMRIGTIQEGRVQTTTK